jgi:hypothetical protein
MGADQIFQDRDHLRMIAYHLAPALPRVPILLPSSMRLLIPAQRVPTPLLPLAETSCLRDGAYAVRRSSALGEDSSASSEISESHSSLESRIL